MSITALRDPSMLSMDPAKKFFPIIIIFGLIEFFFLHLWRDRMQATFQQHANLTMISRSSTPSTSLTNERFLRAQTLAAQRISERVVFQ
jgi:hypothetical protein